MTPDDVTIRRATDGDTDLINAAMARLALDLGDAYRVTADDLKHFGFGENPSFTAFLAECDGKPAGAALCSPLFSTIRGGPGIYVSDLWVSDEFRGRGLGRRLLQYAMEVCREIWGAEFLKLSVYHTNEDAKRAYDRMGFEPMENEVAMIVTAERLTKSS